MQDDYRMLIDGELVAGDRHIDVINPATGEPFATAPDASASDLDRAVAAARRAFPAWRASPIAERRRLICEAADRIEAHADELSALFTREQGRPTFQAREEVIGAAAWLRNTAALDLPVEVITEDETHRIEVHHEPLGVVCAIVPWNFPVAIACWKIGPSLLAGNTLVLKPSPFTPLATLRIGALIGDLFPAGVLNIVSGGDGLGPMMTAHPGFAKISFTGSTATGKSVMETAARDLKRITMELGGNDAAIVLPDANLDKIAERIFFGAFYNSAQICAATKRLYVHESIYDDLRGRLHAMAREMAVGDGAEQGVMFGPIQNAPQYRRVIGILKEARESGLTILDGRPVPDGGGYFVPLTIVDNPPEDARVVTEETFGPILPMMRFSDVDEVIDRANATHYGLAGSIWSADDEKAMSIARRLETGTVWINTILHTDPRAPASGSKHSGIGVESGLPGLLEFTQTKTIHRFKAPA